MKKLLLLLFLFVTHNLYAVDPSSLLKPDKAFQLSIDSISADSIKATWKIADGYYMYRKKFSFSSDNPNISFGKPIFPTGILKKDPAFGEVVIYRDEVSIQIPVNNKNDISKVNLKTKSQGCADVGVCYPPQKVSLPIEFPATKPMSIDGLAGIDTSTTTDDKSELSTVTTAPITKPSITATDLGIDLGIPTFNKNGKSGAVSVDTAFALDIAAQDKQTLVAHWQVLEGNYLYRKKIRFALLDAEGIELGKWEMPKNGHIKKDQTYSDAYVYDKDIEIKIPLVGKASAVKIKTNYQGCSSVTGICYPPQKKIQTIDLSNIAAPSASPLTAISGLDTGVSTLDNNEKISAQDEFKNILETNNLFTILGLFFLAGLALTFTPCVFPMIPILSGIISGQGDNISKKKAFILSLAYVLPMALTYAIVGVLAGLSGESLTAALQTPWVIATFALLFVVLSFAMFGFYELQMPAAIQNRLTSVSNQQKGGTLIGAAIMGMLSALIVGPCVTAPLTGALIFIADTKDAFLGGLSLFMLGIGMGVPLLMIGTVAGSILPKAGAWMDKVKAVFGVLMLALAIWMLERILPVEMTILLTAILLVGSAIYMKAMDSLDATASGWDRLWKALGIILLVYGIILILGVAKGNKSFFTPLKDKVMLQQVVGGAIQTASAEGLVFSPIKGIKGLDAALDNSSAQNKLLMLDFYADWCVSCKEMEHKVFTDPRIIKALEGVVLVQADVTENDEQDKDLMKKFGLFGPPGILFFDTKKQEYRSFRVVGEMSADKFFAHINEFIRKTQ